MLDDHFSSIKLGFILAALLCVYSDAVCVIASLGKREGRRGTLRHHVIDYLDAFKSKRSSSSIAASPVVLLVTFFCWLIYIEFRHVTLLRPRRLALDLLINQSWQQLREGILFSYKGTVGSLAGLSLSLFVIGCLVKKKLANKGRERDRLVSLSPSLSRNSAAPFGKTQPSQKKKNLRS